MRSPLRSCLCFAFVVATLSSSAQQQNTEPTPKPIATEPADSVSPKDPANTEPATAGSTKVTSVAPHATRTLPANVQPNPPAADELKLSEETWEGEYEADNQGQVILGLDAKPIPVLYNRKGKRLPSKYKPPKTHPINIVNGALTVDGWTGKARLNHDIPDLKYIYLSVPGVGTVIVSQSAFPGSVEQKAAFNGSTLTVRAGEHEVQLSSDAPLLKDKQPVSAYVGFNAAFLEDPKYPVMGYGTVPTAPYEWPDAKQAAVKGAADTAPPLPASMRAKVSGAAPVCIAQPGRPCAAAPTAPAQPQ